MMHEMLYERSKMHILSIKDYKTPVMDAYMRLFSFLGDGDCQYFFIVLVWARGHWNKKSTGAYESDYFGMVFSISVNISYILKSYFHHSRPIFDDLSLADTHMKDCAVEFGNPSGHSVNAITFIYTGLEYYTTLNKTYFTKNKGQYLMVWTLGHIYIISVVYSRIYTGRHTFDQCLHGVLLGLLISHFFIYYWRPKIIDSNIKVDSNHIT